MTIQTQGNYAPMHGKLILNNVTINGENGNNETLKPAQQNYYRANDIFGDTATKQQEFPNDGFVPSALNSRTEATPYVEDVVANVDGTNLESTSRDAKMADIFAKQIGTWTKNGETIGGGFKLEQTDAYKFALSMNADDYTVRESEYKGQKEEHAYFDNAKSDKNITLFSTEKVNGAEYLAMKDADGKVHYFDKSDNLKAINLE